MNTRRLAIECAKMAMYLLDEECQAAYESATKSMASEGEVGAARDVLCRARRKEAMGARLLALTAAIAAIDSNIIEAATSAATACAVAAEGWGGDYWDSWIDVASEQRAILLVALDAEARRPSYMPPPAV